MYSGGSLVDPLTAAEREDLLWYLEEYPAWPYEEFAGRAREVEDLLVGVGKRLYQSVFGKDAASLVQPWRLQPGARRQVSIISQTAGVLGLPWELLHDEQGFMALRTRDPVSIVRRLPQTELSALPMRFEPPLRVLIVTARPEGPGFVDSRGIAGELLDELGGAAGDGSVAIEFLRPPTLDNLRDRLRDLDRPPVHVLHFDGHGTFDADEGGSRGRLAFEDADGRLDAVPADVVAQVLQGSGLRLAVLTACRSALGTEDPFSSIAAQLIRSGVDAVVAMGANLLVSGAARYAEGFYRALAAGTPVPAAQQRARQAMHDNPRRHLQRRHRDDPGSPVLVRDWWLPQLFQQRPFDLHPEAQARKGAKKPKRSPTLLRTDGVPCGPRHGFIGRALEIQRIEKYLTRGRLVVVRGPVGSGKTTLAREAADWLTRTGLYTGTCLVSFAHGGDASSLLRTIGGRLGLTASKFDPEDPAGAIEKVRKPAREKPLLVVADDLESLLPGGRAALDTTARAALWDVVLELPGLGCGALLIGGEGTLGDARLAPGKWVAHLAIEGLDPQDAVLLADQLLSELGIERARIPYRDLCGLLGQLDNLPLPMQLVLPSLRDVHRVKLQADLAAALERAAAGPGADLPRSLLAALDLWLGRLPDGTRSLLDRFSPFAVGADERRLLQVTQIPDAEWADLRATRAVRAADRRTSGRCRRPHFPTIPPDPGAIPAPGLAEMIPAS